MTAAMVDTRGALRPQSAHPSMHLSWAQDTRPQTSPAASLLAAATNNPPPDSPDNLGWALEAARTPPVKLPRALQKAGRPQSTGSVGAAKNSTHRPPLPAAGEGRSLVIEGNQTGQVVAVEGTQKRAPQDVNYLDRRRNSQNQQDYDRERRQLEALERERKERNRDKQLIRKLENEVKRLKDVLATKETEITGLQETIADLESKAQQQCETKDAECQQLRVKLEAKRAEFEQMTQRIRDLRSEGDTLRAALEAGRCKAEEKEQEANEVLKGLQAKVAALGNELEAILHALVDRPLEVYLPGGSREWTARLLGLFPSLLHSPIYDRAAKEGAKKRKAYERTVG